MTCVCCHLDACAITNPVPLCVEYVGSQEIQGVFRVVLLKLKYLHISKGACNCSDPRLPQRLVVKESMAVGLPFQYLRSGT